MINIKLCRAVKIDKAIYLILGLLIWTLGFPILFAATGWPTPTAVFVIYGVGIFGIGMALNLTIFLDDI